MIIAEKKYYLTLDNNGLLLT